MLWNPACGGWIAVERDMRTDPVVGFGQPVKPADPSRGAFSIAEAWLDLKMSACHTTAEWINKGRKQALQPGQLPGAYSFLADRWNWTTKQVRCFLDRLIRAFLIEKKTQNGSHETVMAPSCRGKQGSNQIQVLTICNNRVFTETDGVSSAHQGQAKGKRRASQGHEYKEDKKIDSPNGESSPTASGDLLSQPIVDENKGRTLKRSEAAKMAVDAWNEMAASCGLPKARTLNQDRQTKLALRIKEAGGFQAWVEVIRKIPKSQFLVGDNDRGWRPTIDFVCQPSSFTKLMEGAYDGKHRSNGHSRGYVGFSGQRDVNRMSASEYQDFLERGYA